MEPPLPHSDSLFLYIQVPLRQRRDGSYLIEAQAANGLRLWAENFPHLIVGTLVQPSEDATGYVPLTDLGEAGNRIEFLPLPVAYRLDVFLTSLPAARRKIRDAIARARWLCFAIGGLVGDWGAVAAIEASRAGRRYAVWTDRVESDVTRHAASSLSGRAALRARLFHRPMAALERHVIRRASLGLFHGRETYDAYAPFCRQPELVHDIHLSRADHISDESLVAKALDAHDGPLRIFYAGRMEPMKGPTDWLVVLHKLEALGIAFRAEWIGEGSLLRDFRATLASKGLAERVAAPGNVADRVDVLARFRRSTVFLFCHQTAESPRCLIEALMSGTPLVGYDSAFPRDLISAHGGGRLTPRGNIDALVSTLAHLDKNRRELSDLINAAACDGRQFDDQSVFAHRSELIKRYI